MANNKIPRKSRSMDVEFLIETSSESKFMKAEKTDRGWVGTTEAKEKFFLPLAMLRNAEVCKLTNIV